MRRDIPDVPERILHSRIAIAVILIDRLIDRDRPGVERPLVGHISIGNVKMKRGWHGLVWSVRLPHSDDRIANANLSVMHRARRVLRAENLLGTECPLEEIDHLRRAFRM